MSISREIATDIKEKINYVVSKGDEMYICKVQDPLTLDIGFFNYMTYDKYSYQDCEKVDNFYKKYKVIGIYDVKIGVRYFLIEDIIAQLPDSVLYEDFDAINICLAEKKVIVYRKISKIRENRISSKELFEKAKQMNFVLKHNGLEYTLQGKYLDFDSFSKMQIEELFEKFKDKECPKWTMKFYLNFCNKALFSSKYSNNFTLLSLLMQVEKSILDDYSKIIIISPYEYENNNTVRYKYEYEDGFLVYEYRYFDYNSSK